MSFVRFLSTQGSFLPLLGLGLMLLTPNVPTLGAAGEPIPLMPESPDEHILKAYQSSRILMIGIPNHSNKTPYLVLKKLLEKVGTDPQLKVIALERYHDSSELYEALSSRDVQSDQDAQRVFSEIYPDRAERRKVVCRSPEVAFTIKDFLPVVQAANRERPLSNQIRSIPIDGMSKTRDRSWPGSVPSLKEGCALPHASTEIFYARSSTRERNTLANFKERVLTQLAPSEKAIVVYHYAHLLRGFKSCMPGYVDTPAEWHTAISSSSWGEMFAEENPEQLKETQLIIFDLGEKLNPYVNFKVTQALRKKFPKQEWAFSTKALFQLDIAPERGKENFTDSAYFPAVHPGELISEASLPALFDGLIHIPDTEVKNSIGPASLYYPELCAYL